jgi:type IV secretory pathway VirJ component
MKRLLVLLLLLCAAPLFAEERCDALVDVSGLPLVELPARGSGDRFAVMITGDGGWRRIDDKVTDVLRAEGIPVVGFSAPGYFNVRRTPEESACALARVIRHYSLRWKRSHVVLIGYSRGADVLPFLVSRLPADLRASVSVVALLGLEPTIDFRYHPSWIPFYHPHEAQQPVAPEMEKLRGTNVLCVYGEREHNSLCPKLDPAAFRIVREPGSHHFAGRYAEVGRAILDASR